MSELVRSGAERSTGADQVKLRPVLEDDLVLLNRYALDPEVTGRFLWNGWTDSGIWHRRWAANGLLEDDRGILLVVRRAERLGFVSWRKVFGWRSSFHWSIGVTLLPEARGLGYGSRAQRLLVCYLFAHTQAVRVEAITESGNIAEQRSLEKAGFTREGLLRSYHFRNGRWHDALVYAVLRDEVPLEELEQQV